MNTPADRSMRFDAVAPQFTLPDIVRTAEHYRDAFGIRIADCWGSPSRSGRAHGAYDMYLRVTGVERIAEELCGRGTEIVEGRRAASTTSSSSSCAPATGS